MRNLIYVLFILCLFSCDEDEENNIKVPIKEIPKDTLPECNFNSFDMKFRYIQTLANNSSQVHINENSNYDEKNILDNFTITITSENSRDTTDSLKIVALQVGCNYTGTEFDVDNCRIVSEMDFPSTKAYCGGLDDFLFDRVRDAEMTYHSKDTIVLYEKGKNWFHYFISDTTKVTEQKQELPKLRLTSNEIYAADDTLYLPLNINFLKNDSTNCYFYGMKVEPQYKDWDNSFVILPESDKPMDIYDDYRVLSNFITISRSDTICRIDSIIFFRYKWFNNVEVNIEKVYYEIHNSRMVSHPFYGSNSTSSSWTMSNSNWKVKSNSSIEGFNPIVNNYHTLLIKIEKEKMISILIEKPKYSQDALKGKSNFEISNLDLDLKANISNYEFIFTNKEYLSKNLKISYSAEYINEPSSTRIYEYEYLSNFQITDSSYVKLKFWRD